SIDVLNDDWFVLTRKDDCDGKVVHCDGRGNHSRNNDLRHTALAQTWQTSAKAIQKAGQQGQILGQKNDSMRLENFKTSQLQKIANISGRKPVLFGTRNLHPGPFRKCNEWFPKVIVCCYQHPSMSPA